MNKNYKIFDPESGEYSQVSEEAYKAYRKRMDMFKGLLNTEKEKGKIQIHSTAVDENNNEDFKNLWTQQ